MKVNWSEMFAMNLESILFYEFVEKYEVKYLFEKDKKITKEQHEGLLLNILLRNIKYI